MRFESLVVLVSTVLLLVAGCSSEESKPASTGAGGGATSSTSDSTTTSTATTTSSSGGGMGGGGGGPGCVDETDCEDDDACTADSCEEGSCANNAVDIEDGDACTVDACDPLTGVSHTAIEIDDLDACTVDACDALTGVNHVAVAIDDSDACTMDACDPLTGVSHTAIEIDDLDACTVDACDALTGVNHVAVAIDDSDACTMDACNTTTGAITHTAIPINDNNACTVDACNVVTGAVTHTAVPIDDANACTVDACNTTTGAVTHTAVPIDDSDACTADACNVATGAVTHTAVPIDDGNACTLDACDPSTGAINHNAVPITDNDACTTDACNALTGAITHIAVSVDDNDACTVDACNSSTGAITHNAVPITDNDACTVDACNAATGAITHVAVNIDDSNACTTDACNTVTGAITHTAVPISDNDACTTDTCDAATGAISHTAVTITDNDSCTADVCHPVTGVSHTPIYTPSAFAISELGVSSDYVIVTNTSTCPQSTTGLQVKFDDLSGPDVTTVIPSLIIPAAGTFKVTDTLNPPAPEIYAGANIAFAPGVGGAMLLCNGSCSTGSNVLDAMTFGVGLLSPALPSPVTFSPTGLKGVTVANQTKWTYHRVGFAGVAPNFLAADWLAGRPCAIGSMEIAEVNIGTTSYVVLQNTAYCTQNLAGLQLLFDDTTANNDVTLVLPSQTLLPGEFVRITEGTPTGTDIGSGPIPFDVSRGGNALLCNGSCAVGANVIDALSFDGSLLHPALPAPVSFTNAGVSGITALNQDTHSFVHTGVAGIAPAFKQADWVVKPLCSSPANLRLGELHIGSTSFLQIDNPAPCGISLQGVEVLFDDSSIGDVTVVLPAQTLASRTSVYVQEGSPVAPNILAPAGIPFAVTRGGAAILCNGVCSAASSANVIDLIAFSTGAPFPTLPTGATFSGGGLVGITSGTVESASWLRAFRNGVSPAFVGADWTVGPPSL